MDAVLASRGSNSRTAGDAKKLAISGLRQGAFDHFSNTLQRFVHHCEFYEFCKAPGHVDEALSVLDKANKKVPRMARGKLCGANGGTRTHDLRFTKPLLYQLSYVSSPFSIILAFMQLDNQAI